jgi:hypothetical protein
VQGWEDDLRRAVRGGGCWRGGRSGFRGGVRGGFRGGLLEGGGGRGGLERA